MRNILLRRGVYPRTISPEPLNGLYVVYNQNLILFESKTHREVSGILSIHSRKLTQMTKIGNVLNVLVLLNEECAWLQHRTNHRNAIRL